MAETTLREILKLSPEERKRLFQASGLGSKNIDKVTIDNNTFTDYSAFSFIMEKSYVKSPKRSANGSIENLDSYATFLLPHLKIDFGLISITSYRTIMKLLRSKNEFTVTCYDVVNDRDVTHKMYFSTEQMPKLLAIAKAINGEEWVELLGIQDFTVELVGTNSSLDTVSVTYHFNPPETSGGTDITIGSDSIPKGSEIIVGDIASEIKDNAPTSWKFKQWNDSADGTGAVYTDGFVTTINDNLVLYAVWEQTDNYTLNYNYGLSAPMINSDMTYNYSKSVVYGKSIGSLPTFDALPYVTYGDDDSRYYPYANGAWYRTPVKADNSTRVKDGDLYWIEQDSTIYLIYDIVQYNVEYYVSGIYYATVYVKYGVSVPLPTLVQSGYQFDGWYTDANYTKKFSGSMPPHSLNLYARWI